MSQATGNKKLDQLYAQLSSSIPEVRENARKELAKLEPKHAGFVQGGEFNLPVQGEPDETR